jgi:CRP-like cAMP-binding protein
MKPRLTNGLISRRIFLAVISQGEHKDAMVLEKRNILLDLMSDGDRSLLAPSMEEITLAVRQPLFEPYRPIESVYFMLSGLSSEIARAGDGDRVEVGCVGREGLSGHTVLLGVDNTPHEAFVQVAGSALRIGVAEIRQAMEASSTLRQLLLRYVHVFMTQIAASALADARFTIDQRLARWLLMSQDRLGDVMPLTHDFLSLMLAVRRSGVTDAIHILEGDQLIRAGRGVITVRDRQGLVNRAGGSYGLPEREYERIMGATASAA